VRQEAGLVSWKLYFSSQAQKDSKKIAAAGYREQTEELLAIVKGNPFKTPPPFEKLSGDLAGYYSRRINIQHRLVYQVFKNIRAVKIIRMYTHYK